MRVIQVGYERVFNLGQYQSERISTQVQVDPDDDPVECMDMARTFVFGESTEARARRDEAERKAAEADPSGWDDVPAAQPPRTVNPDDLPF